MNIFQIPTLSENQCDLVIGIIDASGSMEPHWSQLSSHWNKYVDSQKALTIVFDTIPQIVESNILDSYLGYHGGGGTNLSRAFNLFEQKLAEIPENKSITVLFVSDGQDNNRVLCEKKIEQLKGNETKRRINFLCLGIGKDFPTFLSIKLREKYHNGDDSIPAIFLIEYASEIAFTNKFEILQDYFSFNKKRNIKPKVCTFPWREYENEVYENSWVLVHENTVYLEDQIIDVSEFHLNIEGICELFRSWAQMIHLEIFVENEDVETRAKKTLTLVEDILLELKEQKKIDLLKLLNESDDKNDGFKNKAWNNYIRNHYGRIKWYYDDIKNTASGNLIHKIDQFDAAKRIGIGTIMGTAKQKVLQNKGLTQVEFEKIKNEFKKIFANTTLVPYSSQDVSIVSLQNQKDIFLEKDFIEGLNYCKSQYELIKSFPLIGVALKIKRDSKQPLNPWLIKVQNISKVHKVLESTVIVNNNGGLNLPIGDTTESITGVLPLFFSEDKDLKPLITSDFYQLVMTQNVLNNVDSIVKNCYLSLLAHTLIYLIKNKEESNYWKELIQGIIFTESLISSNNFAYQKYKNDFSNDPINTFENDPEMQEYGINRLAKGILALVVLHQEKKITEEKILIFIKYIAFGFVYYLLMEKNNLQRFAQIKLIKNKSEEEIEEIMKNSLKQNYESFYTMGDFRRMFYNNFNDLVENSHKELEWTVENGLNTKTKYSLTHLFINNFLEFLNIKFQITEENWKQFICLHVMGHKAVHYFFLSNESLEKQVSLGEQEIINKLMNEQNPQEKYDKNQKKKKKEIIKNNPLYKKLSVNFERDFQKYFMEIHKLIIPPTQKEIEYHKLVFKLDKNDIGNWNNTCQAKKCPFYLKFHKKRLSHHLNIWGSKLPKGFHHLVKDNFDLSNEQLYSQFLNSNPGFNMSFFETSKEEIYDYLDQLKEFYYNNNQFNK